MHHSRHIPFVAFWGGTSGFPRAPFLSSNSSGNAASPRRRRHEERREPTASLRVLIHISAKSLVRSATLPALRCLTQSGMTEWRLPVTLVGALPRFHTPSNPDGDQDRASHAATPKFSCNPNNTHRRCYAPVTHDLRCRAWKRLLEGNLNQFLAHVGRSWRSSWLGRPNNGISEEARERLPPATPPPKTPACVTHSIELQASLEAGQLPTGLGAASTRAVV